MLPLRSDVIGFPLCLTVPHNLLNQGLQFGLTSATFFTQTVLLRIVRLKKKKKPSSSALYIYIWFCYWYSKTLGLIFWLTLEILTIYWILGVFRMCELSWNQMLNWCEDLCQSDSLCCSNMVSWIRRHVLVYIFKISGQRNSVTELLTLLRSAKTFLMRFIFDRCSTSNTVSLRQLTLIQWVTVPKLCKLCDVWSIWSMCWNNKVIGQSEPCTNLIWLPLALRRLLVVVRF